MKSLIKATLIFCLMLACLNVGFVSRVVCELIVKGSLL